MQNNPVVSIIVPVYNAEKFLPRCLESIQKQTFTNFECIIIDDGSPDKCGIICDDFAKLDNRFIVVHQENKGVSEARNAGLKRARGEWISFIDSDDFIADIMIESLYSKALNNNCDISICGIKYVNTDVIEINKNEKFINRKITAKKCVSYLKKYLWLEAGPCNKLFNRKVLDNVFFNKNFKFGEDTVFILEALEKSYYVYVTSKPFYYYFQVNNSLSHTFSRSIVDYAYFLENKYNAVPFFSKYSKATVVYVEYVYASNNKIPMNKNAKRKICSLLFSNCFSVKVKIAIIFYSLSVRLYTIIKGKNVK